MPFSSRILGIVIFMIAMTAGPEKLFSFSKTDPAP